MKTLFITIFLLLGAVPAALAADSDRVRQMEQDAVQLFNKGDYGKAVGLFNEILSLAPDNQTAPRYLQAINQQMVEPYCKQAATAYISGNYAEAITNWEQILKINPADRRVTELIGEAINESNRDSIENLYSMVDTSLKEGNYDAAIDGLEKIILIDAKEQRAQGLLKSIRQTALDTAIKKHYGKADSYLKSKQYDLAIEEWKEVLRIDEKQELASRLIASAQRARIEAMYTKAKQMYEAGEYMGSRDLYYQILGANPTDEAVKKILNRLSGVIGITSQLEGKEQQWHILRKGLANHISEEGSPEVAIVSAWYALQLDPESMLISAIKGLLEREHSNIIHTLDAPTADMNIIEQYLFLALNHIYEGRYDRAIQKCTIVSELQPGNITALKRLGSAYYAIGRRDKAREAWTKALRLAPNDASLKKFIEKTK